MSDERFQSTSVDGYQDMNGSSRQDVDPTNESEPIPDTYLEFVEKKFEGQRATSAPNDDSQQTGSQVVPFKLPDDAVILPMTLAEFEAGMKSDLFSSARWMAEWCMMVIKKYGRRVFFKS